MNCLASRVQRIKPSPTLVIAARANKLLADGEDIINLSIGEPDFDTPDHIKEAAMRAIRDGFTKYTAVAGIASLKQAVCDKFQRDNNISYQPAQVLVSCGVKQGLYNLFQAVIQPGDEVIISVPYWTSYPDMVLLADGIPVFLESNADKGFKITPDQLAAAITPKTKIVLLNSPSNPSGMAYTKDELAALGDILLQHPHVLIASDDMYETIYWGKESFNNILTACPELYSRTILFNGVSKSYAMTGWRIGYAAGPEKVITAMTNIQSQSTSSPNSIAQKAAQAAMEGDQTCVQQMKNSYHQRYHLFYEGLTAIAGIRCLPSDGTFYCFPDVSQLVERLPGINNDIALAEYLLQKAGLAVVPGSAFGDANCIRMSFATSEQQLKDALQRLREAIDKYQ